MDTDTDYERDSNTSSAESESLQAMKAISAPAYPVPVPSSIEVKPDTSAPFYLFSLKENDAPPFKKPEKEPKPKILIGSIMSENNVVEMIAATNSGEENGLKKWLGAFLVEKEIILNFNLSEKTFLVSLLKELIDYAARHDFSALKLSVLITIYLNTHMYFKWYYWNSPSAVWYYFMEVMIRHTIEDSPDGEEVFEPNECYDIVTHFHTVYLSNLPLVHILTFGTHRLKIGWPFKLK